MHLGPYEIVAAIGAGGMGEVYRARDTRLDRTVAVKILPSEFAQDGRLRSRFEREAKAISALNHPHICTVHDVGSDDGIDYLVMEYCEGNTLAKRIADGPLPLEQVFDYGIQIADALEKAHREGIIHRDLKPTNIMLTKAGTKLLDFGLAKHHAESLPAESTVQQLTEEGKILGTIQYMAPEVLHGREADARSDIFALGIILYEMVTGRRAFDGDSKPALIASILSSEPPSMDTQRLGVSHALDHFVRRCLEKDPDERWQTAHDIGAELRWIRDAREVPAEEAHRGRKRVGLWLGAVLLLAGAVGVTWYVLKPDARRFRAERFEIEPPAGVHVGESGGGSVLAISPDGEWVAFRGVSDEPNRVGLYLRSTKELDARLIRGAAAPFFSPDSKWLGFAADGYLQKVPVSGGEPRRICEVSWFRGASWGDDGTILFSNGAGLLHVSADGGQPEVLSVPPAGERHYWPQFLPGSKRALFVVHRGFSDSWRKVAVFSLKDRKIHELLSGTSPHYVRGHLVYSHLGTLHAARFDLHELKVTDEPKAILDDVYFYNGSAFSAFDLSHSGSLVYMPGAGRIREAELVWVDRQGRATPVLEDRRGYDAASISPDGKRLAVTINTTLEDSDLWIYEIERGSWTRLTSGKRVAGRTTWSRDGKWLIFSSFASGHFKLFRIATDGSGNAEQLTSGVEWEYPGNVSVRDNVLVFMRQVQTAQWDLLTLSFDSRQGPRPFLATPFLEAQPFFSPNGRWVAYESDETGRREIHVRPYPGPGPRVTVSTNGGNVPFWSHDGRELLYRHGKEIWSAPVSAADTFRAGRPQLLFRADFLGEGIWDDAFDISPDGKILTVRQPPESRPQRRLVYVPNWIAEMRQVYNQKE
jgi:serine/threonine-protein kinase